MEIQIFGTKSSKETRAALRFFAERRVRTHFVDLKQRAASAGELRRFAQRFGVQSLIDRDSKAWAESGLAHASYPDDRWLDTLVEQPLLLRQPLVRWGQKLTIGAEEATWRQWVEEAKR